MAHLDKELQQREKQINVDYSNNKENICNEVQDKNLVLPLHEDRFVQVMKVNILNLLVDLFTADHQSQTAILCRSVYNIRVGRTESKSSH